MLILIAESKTMNIREEIIPPEMFCAHMPRYEQTADAIMDGLRNLNYIKLAEKIGISLRLAQSLHRMAYEFPNKQLGLPAIEAFSGVVFRQLHPAGYSGKEREFMNRHVRIISSLYGWLKPDDIIKPYRLEFKSPVAPGDQTLMKYWKKDVTLSLVKELKENLDTEIIDLSPADASKCIDWKLVKRFAKVYKVDFKTLEGSDLLKTPNAGRLKELRGRLLDRVITSGCTTAAEISRIETDDFLPSDHPVYPGTLPVLTA